MPLHPYAINADNDVLAIDVESGDILWRYRADPDPCAGNPFGRSNRCVALGEGRVYAGFLDATVAAIDQQTGREIWRAPVAPWQAGYSIPAAPLYYDGLVISGVSGGVMGRRGRVTAFDADAVETAAAVTAAGRNNMPAFGGADSIDELYAVAAYIVERLARQ